MVAHGIVCQVFVGGRKGCLLARTGKGAYSLGQERAMKRKTGSLWANAIFAVLVCTHAVSIESLACMFLTYDMA